MMNDLLYSYSHATVFSVVTVSEMGNIGQAQKLGARLAAASADGLGGGDQSNVRYSHVGQQDEYDQQYDSEDSKVKIVIRCVFCLLLVCRRSRKENSCLRDRRSAARAVRVLFSRF